VDFLIVPPNFAQLRAFLNIDISIRGVIKLLSYKYKSFKKDKDELNKYIAKKFKMEIDDVDGKEQQS